MTNNEAECLAALHAVATTNLESIDTGFRPLDLGGSDRSHHAQTLIRMVPKGWVERSFGQGFGVDKVGRSRGSCRYRITRKGIEALSNHQVCVYTARSISKAQCDKVPARLAARKVQP